jgi:hypothetical protein
MRLQVALIESELIFVPGEKSRANFLFMLMYFVLLTLPGLYRYVNLISVRGSGL